MIDDAISARLSPIRGGIGHDVEIMTDCWMEDLLECPSQIRYYFEDGKGVRWCLYLRWRHRDPWRADLVRCDEKWGFRPDHPDTLHGLLGKAGAGEHHYMQDEYGQLEKAVLQAARMLFPDHLFQDRRIIIEP